MKKMHQLVIDYIAEFQTQGWNKKQAKQLAWAEFFEEKLAQWEMKSRGLYSPEIRIDCYCADCKDGGQLLPGTTIMWLGMHKGHNTKTIKIR
jgi:hypothetical protein